MSAPVEHNLTIEPVSPTRWRSVCSCGKYKSIGYAYKGAAEDSGRSHVRSSTRAAANR